MAYCSNCGASVSGQADTCPKCGNIVSTQPKSSSSMNPDEVIAEETHEEAKHVDSTIPLVDGESILWHRGSTQGLIHKELFLEEAVTNKRCLKYDPKNKQIIAQIGISRRPEVVVMNLHRVNDSIGGGIFLSPRMFGIPFPGGVYGGPRRGFLKVSGDVSFMSDGKVILTFENVKDPRGIKQLVEALKREAFTEVGISRPWWGPRVRPRQP